MRQDRRRIAGAIGAAAAASAFGASGLAWGRDPDPGGSFVAAVTPSDLPPARTLETSTDPYRRMTAPVFIQGQGPFYFVVDTGANQSVISEELAASLNLPNGAAAILHGVAGAQETRTVVAARFEVGKTSWDNLVMPALPEQAIGAAGILGIDRLRRQRVTLDFQARRLTIEPSHHVDRSSINAVLPARLKSGQLMIVDADLAGMPISAFLDSGAEHTIGNPALLRQAILRIPENRFNEVPIISVTGRTIRGQMAVLPILRLGNVRVLNVPVTFADLHIFEIWGLREPAMLVGVDALSIFDSVALDFQRKEVWFTHDPSARHAPTSWR